MRVLGFFVWVIRFEDKYSESINGSHFVFSTLRLKEEMPQIKFTLKLYSVIISKV